MKSATMKSTTMKSTIALLLAGVTLAGAAPAAEPLSAREQTRLDRALAGRTAGQPISCIPRGTNVRVDAVGDGILLYGAVNRTLYRNDPVGGCNGAGRDNILVSSSTIGQICRGDIIRVVDRTSRFEVGSCALTDFIPYTRPKRTAAR